MVLKDFVLFFITAAFAYSGTEIVGIAAAESSNPRKYIPRATKQVVGRVLLFYIISILMITFIVPSDTKSLMGDSNDPSSSPFVIALQQGKIH